MADRMTIEVLRQIRVKMEALKDTDDPETAHIKADQLLIDALYAVGEIEISHHIKAIETAWGAIDKWWS